MGSDQRNMILAIVLSAIVLLGWTFMSDRLFPTANPPATKVVAGKQVAVPNPAASPADTNAAAVRDRVAVLSEGPRVRIRAPRLAGSIALKGARIDDLVLPTYRETIDKNSPPIRLFSPAGTKDSYFSGFGWSGQNVALPDANTIWTASAPELTPAQPVSLSWDNGRGQRFVVRIAIDNDFLFTVTQTVANTGTGAVAVKPFALVSRVGKSKDPSSWTNHTGPVAFMANDDKFDVNFKDLDSDPAGVRYTSTGGWIGFGDKYWLAAVAPDQNKGIEAAFRGGPNEQYQADFSAQQTVVQPGRAVAFTSYVFAGAKEVGLLERYETNPGLRKLNLAIDWGWFYWFEKPIFWLLDWLFRMVGNFGVAIIILTLIVRGAMFPVAQRQFRSMAGMRVIQPKMKALQERYKDDKERLQKEVMDLYKQEKVNPFASCAPVLLQIPVFYALYKVLMITIEMRHQPFVLWIKDLSAPDPLTPVNLFGLLPFQPSGFLHLGVLAILLGLTMWLQFKTNPAPMDDAQKQVFQFMPWIFMFVMAPFAAGLQLYWVVSNSVTILQQQFLYSRHPGLKQTPAK